MVRAIRRMLAVLAAATLLPAWLLAQEPGTISGQVQSADGKPIANATVAIPELGLGATTRSDGKYSITVPPARVQGQRVTITARAINYKPQTSQLTIGPGETTQDFSLAANPLQLGEIVVTGTGTETTVEKDPNVRNYVSAQDIANSHESNAIQALAGKAPGVLVQQNSGEPGAGSFITIRGLRTIIGSQQPLLVVDGTAIDNSTRTNGRFNPTDDGGINGFGDTQGVGNTNRAADLNPDDIESVEILKGAAASALYGSRAAQGVILIKTKAGRAGPTHWSFSNSLSADKVAHYYDLQTRWGQGLNNIDPRVADPAACDAIGGLVSGNCRRSWGPDLTDPATAAAGVAVQTFDHSKEAYNTGYVNTTSASVSGGNDRTTFFASGEYVYNNGVFTGDHDLYQRGTVRINASHHVSDAFKVGVNASYASTFGQFIQRGNNVNGLQLGLLRTPPNFDNQPYLIDLNGQQVERGYLIQHGSNAIGDYGGVFDNPFYTLNEGRNTSQVNRAFGNVNFEYVTNKWLKFNYVLGGDYSQDERLQGAGIFSADVSNGGRMVEGKITTISLDHNLSGTATWHANANVSGTFVVGQTLNIRNFRELGNTGRQLVVDGLFRLSNTVTRDPPVDDQNNIHNESYFGQGTVDLYDQVHLTLAATRYGSSTFSPDKLHRWYPKAGVAWEFSKALKVNDRSFLSYGKARLAYGEAGTEAPAYTTSNVFTAGLFGGPVQGTSLTPSLGGQGGLSSSIALGAVDLGPEISKELEGGVDIGFWRDRADLSFTYYHSITDDVIIALPLAPTSGYLQTEKNGLKLRNAGAEISLNVRPLKIKDFGWEVGVQWAKNQSRVLEVRGPQFVGTDPVQFEQFIAQAGEEFGVIRGFGWVRCGVSPNGLGAAIAGVDLATVCAGAPQGALYIGANGLPVADFGNPRVVGNPNPKWTGNARTTLRYKKVSLSGLLEVKHGGQVWNGTKGALLSYGTAAETADRCSVVAGVCTGNVKVIGVDPLYGLPAQPTVGPGVGTPVAIGGAWYRGNTACPFSSLDEPCIEDGGYVKLREITLGYTLDMPWVQRTLGLSSIELRVAGRNLKTWSNYTGYDPDANLGGAISSRAIDYFNNPQTRSFVFSVTLNR